MIRFRAIEESDLKDMKLWRNSDSVFPFVREYRMLSDYDQSRWFESYQKQRRTSDWDSEIMVLTLDKLDVSIAVGGFTRIEWRNRKAEITFYSPYNDCGMTAVNCVSALKALIKRGFEIFGFNKITWPVYGHDPNLNLYRMILKEEAVLKEEYFWDGNFHDRHYLSLTKKEFDEKLKTVL